MNPIQVAEDYAAEEGFDFSRHEDGSVEVWHPRGAAKVYTDGQVISEPNPRLKEVLERKIAQARAREAQILVDPAGRCTIKFSAEYSKMPMEVLAKVSDTTLLAVLKVKRAQLSLQFLDWDTKFASRPGNFPLPAGQEFLVLLLLTAGQLWTTIRAAWPPEKEDYYRSHVGEQVNIEIQGGKA
jgi:hypothetical protein